MTNSFTFNAGDLCTRAYRRLGILPAGGVATDDQFEQFRIVYNSMALGLQADGVNLYRQTQVSLSIPANVGYAGNPYVITPQIMAMENARVVINPAPNLYERPLGQIPYGDYMNYPNKMAQGTPVSFTLDKQVTQTNLYFFMLPPLGCTINATVARFVDSIAAPSDPLDFPQEWFEGLSYMASDRLMEDEGVAAADEVTATRITQRAVAFYDKLLNWDRPTSIFIRPYGRAGQSKVWRG